MHRKTDGLQTQEQARTSDSLRVEARELAEKYSISQQEAHRLIEQHGNSREHLYEAAQRLKNRFG